MLEEFILANRDAIIARVRLRVASRMSPKPSDVELRNGIPVFLDQLGEALRRARTTDVVDHSELAQSAGQRGQDLFKLGLTIAQVVHDYGDICQTITEMAVQVEAVLSPEEFQILNLCLDDAIAEAVTQYAQQRERVMVTQGTERLGILAHEMRNLLNTAVLSFEVIKSGHVAVSGSTGVVHSRSLLGLRDLIDRSLVDVRLDAGIERLEPIVVAELIEEVEISAMFQAKARGLHFSVVSVDSIVIVEGDRQILAAALTNLLQNAFKFTHPNSHVSLTARANADRVLFEIKDECGGLPAGKIDELFRPFVQRDTNRSGVGLGLVICQKAAKAHNGELYARDVPGHGCVFTLDLPRKLPLAPS